MHSCCRIPGLLAKGKRSKDGGGELDKHPAWKLRKSQKAYGNRLSLKLAELDTRCKEITTRISWGIKDLQSTLDRLCKMRLAAVYLKNEDRYQLDTNQSTKQKGNFQVFTLMRRKKRLLNKNLNTKVNKQLINCEKADCKATSASPCCFGVPTKSSICSHFPCFKPDTYHSLGFRLDNCSTQEWITWADFRKTKLGHTGYKLSPTTGRSNMLSAVSPWCSLPSDFESRKEKLLREISEKRMMNLSKKPQNWETNYGRLVPGKRFSLVY